MRTCSIEGCAAPYEARGFCNRHYLSLWKYGDPLACKPRRQAGMGHLRADGYIDHHIDGRRVLDHIAVAEKVLGKKLPPGAEVHHVNEDRRDNRPTNLVICPDKGYHKLLHARIKALDACGNPNWRKCRHCGVFDDLRNLRGHQSSPYHSVCNNAYQAQAKLTKRLAATSKGNPSSKHL